MTPEELAALDKLTADEQAVPQVKFGWDDTFQRKLLSMLLCDRFFLTQGVGLIKPKYFSNEAHTKIAELLFKYFAQYKSLPEPFLLEEELKVATKDREDSTQIAFEGELKALYTYYVPGLETRDALLDKVTYFAKVQAVKVAFHQILPKITESPEDEKTWSYVYDQWRQAMTIERNHEPGLEYFINIDELFDMMKKKREIGDGFTSAFESIDNALTGGQLFRGEIGAWIGLPGTGKTTIKDTPVIMADGSIKKCQDVVAGDLVMGIDSKPRKVLATHSLVDRVYEVRPVKGESYFVNSKHILSLKNSHRVSQIRKDRGLRKNGIFDYRNPNVCFYNHPARMGDTNIFNISVEDWFKQSNHFKKKMKGWRIGLDFDTKPVKIDPYILGVWLGDGTASNCSVTNEDEPVRDVIFEEAKKRDMEVYVKNSNSLTLAITSISNSESIKNNTLYDDLQSYSLIKNKHIPLVYKTNDRNIRLELLAGLLDTDGELSCGGFLITQKREVLADDICYLARSLGFAAYKKKTRKKCYNNGKIGTYYRVSISGDCSVIPVKILKKQARPRKQVKNVLLTEIEVIDIGRTDEFYGFEIDGDHLFLLGDFTVTHNSLALCKAAVANIKLGHKVLYVTLEMDEVGICQRFTSQFLKKDVNDLLGSEAAIREEILSFTDDMEDKNRLIVKQFPGGQIDVNGIRAFYSQCQLRGFKPDLLIVDYVGEMKQDPTVKTYESMYYVLRDLRGFGVEEQHGTLTAVQPNRSASELDDKQYIDEKNIGSSFDQFKPLDAFWSLNQTVSEKDAEVGRGFVIKHRNGRSRFPFKMHYDYELGTLDITEISVQEYKKARNMVREKQKVEDALDEDYQEKEQKEQSKKPGQRSNGGFKPKPAGDELNTHEVDPSEGA